MTVVTEAENGKPVVGKAVRGGTTQDKRDMWRVGREQELNVGIRQLSQREDRQELIRQRNFRFLSVLGFSAVLMCTWEAVLL